MKTYYKTKIDFSSEKISKHSKYNTYFVIARLLSFLAIIGCIFLLVSEISILSVVLMLVSLVCFAWSLKKADSNEHIIEYYKTQKQVCSNELEGNNANSLNNGESFNDPMHFFTSDLDVFGKGSIYNYINRTVTNLGAKSLAGLFKNPLLNEDDIINRQNAIRELAKEKDFLINLLTTINLNRKKKNPSQEGSIERWLHADYSFQTSTFSRIALRVLPFINVGLFIAMLFEGIFALPFVLFLIIQSFAFGYFNKQTARVYTDLDWCINDVLIYENIIKLFKEKEFNSPLLAENRDKIISYETTLQFLKKIVEVFDKRNTIVGFFTNMLLLQHFFAAIKLENWKAKHRTDFWELIQSLSQLEAFVSFAMYSVNKPECIYPTPDNSNILETTDIGHPLINKETRINNSISIKNKSTSIITGANMAGKSTFLRTVGINLLLAEMGLPVCANSFRFSPIMLFTSMRAVDNLDSGISYFYAEALRLQKLIEVQEKYNNMLFIADELFRGTNSDDKLHASISLIERLINEGKVTTIVATHDLGVTKLEERHPKVVRNYCFETTNKQSGISFDYKLKDGVTSTHNAYLLLQQMGIVL